MWAIMEAFKEQQSTEEELKASVNDGEKNVFVLFVIERKGPRLPA